jgi:hypothetical protein
MRETPHLEPTARPRYAAAVTEDLLTGRRRLRGVSTTAGPLRGARRTACSASRFRSRDPTHPQRFCVALLRLGGWKTRDPAHPYSRRFCRTRSRCAPPADRGHYRRDKPRRVLRAACLGVARANEARSAINLQVLARSPKCAGAATVWRPFSPGLSRAV